MSSHRSPGRPRDPAVNDAILVTALRLLGRNGYGGMSIDAVAAAAGVGKTTIYRRYPTKADLATAALASGIENEDLPPDGVEVEVGLTRALESIACRLREPQSMALVGTLLVEEERTPELIGLFRERVWERRAGQLREILERGQASGEVRADLDVEAVIGMLIGSLYAAWVGRGTIPRGWASRVARAALGGSR